MLKYRVIVVDAPWTYRDKCHAGKRGAAYKYKGGTMTIEDIKALPIASLAADDCYLFSWATMPLLNLGLEAVDAWGFEYVTAGFTWAKTTAGRTLKALTAGQIQPGAQVVVEREGDLLRVRKTAFGGGSYTRANPELCLLGRRGKRWRESAAVRALLLEPVTPQHSEKPAPEYLDRIVELCGDVPRIELFARERQPGWHAWGDEIADPDVEIVDGTFVPTT